MDSFTLHADGGHCCTPVPDIFLDQYMPAANGEYVKIYLWLLRCLKSDEQSQLSISLIADRLERTESDVRRALKYWEKMKLIKLEFDDSKNLTGIRLLDPVSLSAVPAETPAEEDTGTSAPLKPSDAAGCDGTAPLTGEECRELFFVVEQYLGRPLSSQESEKILSFHDTLGFDRDLIEYLVEYCVSRRHRSLRYIETVALSWYDEGYTTAAMAKEHTSTLEHDYFAILKAFGITGRNPVDAEVRYMKKWLRDYGFSLELILEACSRTMAAIHQPGFEYADTILSGWKENGVKSISDVEELDARRTARRKSGPDSAACAASPKKSGTATRFHNFKEREYDYDKLEEMLIKH